MSKSARAGTALVSTRDWLLPADAATTATPASAVRYRLTMVRTLIRLLALCAPLAACIPAAHIPPAPSRVPDQADSSAVALANRLAPTLYVQRDEYFPLLRVVAVVNPTRPIVAYHLLWAHDVDLQWVPWAKPSDEEEVWIGYDPATLAPTDLWTYWHGTILHSSWTREGQPATDVQWGKHANLPHGALESDLPRLKKLNVLYAMEFALLPDIWMGKIAHGGPWGFFHGYARYRDFSRVVPLEGRLDAVARAADPRPALEAVFGRDYSNKLWWPPAPHGR